MVPTSTDHILQSELIQTYNWSATPLGPIDTWPPTLHGALDFILHSNFPMFLWWGEQCIQFYNDAFRPYFGEQGKHPAALGQRGDECWPELWPEIHPLISQVRAETKSVFLEDYHVRFHRNGQLEDAYWTFSLSPVRGPRQIDGVMAVCLDTTEKVNSLQRLGRKEQLLTSTIAHMPLGICMVSGATARVEISNDRFLEMFDKTRQAFEMFPLWEVLPEAQQFEEPLLQQALATGQGCTDLGRKLVLTRAGKEETIELDFLYQPFTDESDGTVKAIIAAVERSSGATHSQETESALRLRTVLQETPVATAILTDPDLRVEMINDSMLGLIKKDRSVIGRPLLEFLPELKEQGFPSIFANVYGTGRPYHAQEERVYFETNGKRVEGYYRHSLTPIKDRDGRVTGLLVLAHDVTDFVRARGLIENNLVHLKNLFSQAPVAICFLRGPSFVIEFANEKICEIWAKAEDEVVNRPLFEVFPHAATSRLSRHLVRVFENGERYGENESEIIVRHNGHVEKKYVNFVYEPLREIDGTISGIMALAIDTTDQVRVRQQVEAIVAERTESLRKSNEELSLFTYVTSHDLQEPARKISTFVDLLQRQLGGMIDKRAAAYLRKIDNSAQRVLKLIRDILTVSQLSRGVDLVSLTDLEVVMMEVLEELHHEIERQNCRIEHDTLPSLIAARGQMKQLFYNIISNALKFAHPERPLQIHIRHTFVTPEQLSGVPALAKAKQYLKISFEDNGIGFKPQYAEQIFDLFKRLHTSSEYEGTGIGLTICRKIVEKHGGYIYAVSAPGKGAMFHLILPVVDAPVEDNQ